MKFSLCWLFHSIADLITKFSEIFGKKHLKESLLFVFLMFTTSIFAYNFFYLMRKVIERDYKATSFYLVFLIVSLAVIIIIYLLYSILEKRYFHYVAAPIVFIILFRIRQLTFVENYLKIYYLFLVLVFVSFVILLTVNWIPINWWTISTIFIISSLLFLGGYFINALYGEKTIDWNLRNCSDDVIFGKESIKCKSKSGIIANYLVDCAIQSNLTNIKEEVYIEYINGTPDILLFEGKAFKFVIPEELARLEFKIHGLNENNKSICGREFQNVRYPTYQEYVGNREKFITYLIGLIVFAFSSVPFIVYHIQEIIKNTSLKKKKRK